MITKRFIVIVPLSILIGIVAIIGTCSGKDIDLPKAGILISLADSWQQIPDDTLLALIHQTRAKAPQIDTPSYVYGFRQTPEVPFATIVISVRKGKMPQAKLDRLPTASGTKEYAKELERRSEGMLKGLKLGDASYDRQHGIIWMKLAAADVMGGGAIRGMSAVILGEEREVQLTGYCDDAAYESFCDEFEGIVYSARKP